jgi:predicted Zn finger-like uncharacterized protein
MASGPIILKCTHCGGMMKVDEAKVPPNRKFKARCPHCQNVDVVSSESIALQGSSVGPLAAPAVQQPTTLVTPPPVVARDSGPSLVVPPTEQEIHFPADLQDEPPARQRMSQRNKLICWAVGSLLWVALFALLVNLILPGPYGGPPVTGLPPQVNEVSSPATGLTPHPAGKPGLTTPAAR